MNPFFIFLFVCATAAIVYWFKNATPKQGITALKGLFICLGCLFIILLVTGRLPLLTGIPLLLLGFYRKLALAKLLIPFIKLLSGSNQSPGMDTELALETLQLSINPSREEIVQAHRKKIRDIQSTANYSAQELAQADAARTLLIQESET
ncbi:MAG: hypothetical protein HRU06_13815 [Oceanospirillaceae bacterium]|nr:hypothetical protein [Oceanospirillaceae bacterium]